MKGKKSLSFKVNEDVHKKLKLLSVEQEKTMANLIEEAMVDLFQKYEPPSSHSKGV